MKKIHRVMVIVMVALVALGLSSIGYTASPVVVRFWNGIGPPEADVLSEFVKEFNEKYAGQHRVEETMMKWDTPVSKLLIDFPQATSRICLLSTSRLSNSIQPLEFSRSWITLWLSWASKVMNMLDCCGTARL